MMCKWTPIGKSHKMKKYAFLSIDRSMTHTQEEISRIAAGVGPLSRLSLNYILPSRFHPPPYEREKEEGCQSYLSVKPLLSILYRGEGKDLMLKRRKEERRMQLKLKEDSSGPASMNKGKRFLLKSDFDTRSHPIPLIIGGSPSLSLFKEILGICFRNILCTGRVRKTFFLFARMNSYSKRL